VLDSKNSHSTPFTYNPMPTYIHIYACVYMLIHKYLFICLFMYLNSSRFKMLPLRPNLYGYYGLIYSTKTQNITERASHQRLMWFFDSALCHLAKIIDFSQPHYSSDRVKRFSLSFRLHLSADCSLPDSHCV